MGRSPRFATLVFAHRSIEGLNKTANGSVWLAMVSDPVPAVLFGQSASVYAERPTFAPLRRHFACTWFHRVPQDRPHRHWSCRTAAWICFWARGSLRIAGPDREAKLEAIPPGTTVVGLRFNREPQPRGCASRRRKSSMRACRSTHFGALKPPPSRSHRRERHADGDRATTRKRAG